MQQLFETLFKKSLTYHEDGRNPALGPGNDFISYFSFLLLSHFFFPCFLFFFPLSFYRFGVSFFHKLHNHNDSTIKVSSVSPLGEIVLCFCCIPTHNLHHQRASSIPHDYLFNLIFFPL